MCADFGVLWNERMYRAKKKSVERDTSAQNDMWSVYVMIQHTCKF